MALLKTKVEFISSHNEDGQYRTESLEFLLRAASFCDAEKAAKKLVTDKYHPREDSDIYVLAISAYKINPDMDYEEELNNSPWFEIHVKMKEIKEDGSTKFKVIKFLKKAYDVTDAEVRIKDELDTGQMFEDFNVDKVIKMPFKEVIT